MALVARYYGDPFRSRSTPNKAWDWTRLKKGKGPSQHDVRTAERERLAQRERERTWKGIEWPAEIDTMDRHILLRSERDNWTAREIGDSLAPRKTARAVQKRLERARKIAMKHNLPI